MGQDFRLLLNGIDLKEKNREPRASFGRDYLQLLLDEIVVDGKEIAYLGNAALLLAP